jgi:hypothetical protein
MRREDKNRASGNRISGNHEIQGLCVVLYFAAFKSNLLDRNSFAMALTLTLDAAKIVEEKLQFFQHKFITLRRCRHDELISPNSLYISPAVTHFY